MKNLFKNLLILNLLCSSIVLFGCNNNQQNNNQNNDDNKNNDDSNKDDDDSKKDDDDNKDPDDSDKDETKETETIIESTDFINLQNADKQTNNGAYLVNDVEDTIGEFKFNFINSIVGVSKNEEYLNCIQLKKDSENLFTLNTSKTITKIIITSLKNTGYDTQYGYLTLSNKGNNLSYSEETTVKNKITTVVSTYTLENSSISGEIVFSNLSERAVYVSSMTIYSK